MMTNKRAKISDVSQPKAGTSKGRITIKSSKRPLAEEEEGSEEDGGVADMASDDDIDDDDGDDSDDLADDDGEMESEDGEEDDDDEDDIRQANEDAHTANKKSRWLPCII